MGRCSPVGRRALRGLSLRLAGVGGGHVHHPVRLDAAHAAAGRPREGGQDGVRRAPLHFAGLHGRADGECPHEGAARLAARRYRGVQLSHPSGEDGLQNQLCVCEAVHGPSRRLAVVRGQPPGGGRAEDGAGRGGGARQAGGDAGQPADVGRVAPRAHRAQRAGLDHQGHGAGVRAPPGRHPAAGRLAQGGGLSAGDRLGDGLRTGVGRGAGLLPAGRRTVAVLPFPQGLLFHVRRPRGELPRFPLLGLRARGVCGGRGVGGSGVDRPRDGARAEGAARAEFAGRG